MPVTFRHTEFPEAAPFMVRGRLTAPDGSGDATGKSGEGNWLEQGDFTAIAWEAFTVTTVAGVQVYTSIDSGTLTIADVILDTPVTTNVNWTEDTVGHNAEMQFDAIFPTGGVTGRLEITATLTGGGVFRLILQGPVTNYAMTP